MCIAVEETNKESILAVMNTTELVVEIRPEKNLRESKRRRSRVAGRGPRVTGKLSRIVGKLSRVPKIVAGPGRCTLLNVTILPRTATLMRTVFLVQIHLCTSTISTNFLNFSLLEVPGPEILADFSCNFLQNRLLSFVCFLLTCHQRASKNEIVFKFSS